LGCKVSSTRPVILPLLNMSLSRSVQFQDDRLVFLGNGSAESKITLSSGYFKLITAAYQQKAGSENVKLRVSLDGKVLTTFSVSNVLTDDIYMYMVSFSVKNGEHKLKFEFTNDYYKPPEDRNLYITDVILMQLTL